MRLTALVLAMLLTGCSAKTYRFEIPVTNATAAPLSVGLIKTGQLEKGWDAPEDVARNAPQLAERRWGRLILPGQTVVLGPQTGRFEPDDFAFLRAYRGDRPIVELVAIGRQSRDRLDIPLDSGIAPIRIVEQDGRLVAQIGGP